MTDKETRINCVHCKYFFVTWDKAHSRGCRFFGFKSHELPSMVVRRTSGMQCLNFVDKRIHGN